MYCDADTATGLPQLVRTPAGLLPLICGAADVQQVQRMTASLTDPQVFNSPAPLPTVAIADQVGLAHAGDMWRGPVWFQHRPPRYSRLAAGRCLSCGCRLAARHHQRTLIFGITVSAVFTVYDCHDTTPPPELPRKV